MPRATVMMGGALLVLGVAKAFPSLQETMYEQYDLWSVSSVQKAQCAYCHTSRERVETLNPFGKALNDFWKGEARGNPAQALYLVLKVNRDADADGYDDVLEVIAGTLPGDKSVKPTASKTQLEMRLKERGGVDSFKPKP
jgi:mono/diheme cytochrome c family protein